MFLSEIFEQLTYGELAQLAIGGQDSGGIDPNDYPSIVSHINLGLTNLHTRLPLKQDTVIIQQYDWIQTYVLSSEYAQTNSASNVPVKYIMDSALKPFTDTVLKIVQVFSEIGEEYPLNDDGCSNSLYTPQHDTLSVPYPDRENALSVVFRAGHPKIIIDAGFDPSKVQVTLPRYLQEALTTYVGARILSGMGANHQQEATALMYRYESLVAQVDMAGLLNRDSFTHSKLEMNGWV